MITSKKPFNLKVDKWIILGVFALILAFMFNGCGQGLPKDLKKEAKAIPDRIEHTRNQVKELEHKYAGLSQSSEFAPIERFAQKENWAARFVQADQELKTAQDLFNTGLKPLIKKDKPELGPQVKQQMEHIKKIMDDGLRLARYPVDRFSNITETIRSAKPLADRSQENTQQIEGIVARLKDGIVAKALLDFPDVAPKINDRFAPLSEIENQSKEHLNIVTRESEQHRMGKPADYAAFTDSSQAIFNGLATAGTLETQLTRELGQLYTSYTKILKDMKEEYIVTIKRESWNENSDYYDPVFTSFQRKVDADTYEALTADNVDNIAAITAGFTGSNFSSQVGQKIWEELKINPTENWPGRGHNAASFYVEDSTEAYFHRYLLEKEGETTETDWEKVDANFFDANLEFLGMAILSKPYGVFEEDRITQATPPGMAYVGNPKYGEWQKDNSGNSFWSWYGKYALFSMLFSPRPFYYGQNSWNSWNSGYRNSRPYFGATANGFQQFGTSGNFVKQSPDFQSSTFAKSGGFKSQAASVRGAGANLRGGGPQSKGK
ncbi:MAG: hypothetical protein KKE62_08850 [Proteobacteria bacterium]|nr:hypothetical protein [Pseudomonadota bacterium]MBU1386248.1 hypothetical protein [Pseudomonadota bacterium]MBU1542941.1 hypothetical protein [Pseudomonadota bacterium]MBU2481608.1 hypothetical protein [Pseudomonadota bacterium]